jgi:hypothetical protein
MQRVHEFGEGGNSNRGMQESEKSGPRLDRERNAKEEWRMRQRVQARIRKAQSIENLRRPRLDWGRTRAQEEWMVERRRMRVATSEEAERRRARAEGEGAID